jgi:DNA-binding response OmpR family regulator
MKRTILYVEDEPSLGKIVRETLQKQGFEVIWITDGATVLGTLSRSVPDICLLDIMLPHIDGYTLCAEIRKRHPDLPIIFITAKTETSDLVKGFEAGGTDYIKKPFSMEELIARIQNQLRLRQGTAPMRRSLPDEITLGSYRFYPHRYELQSPTRTFKLSQRDLEVLEQLVLHRNHSLERQQLLMDVWGDDTFFNSRTLDVYIRKLRKYFSEDPDIEIVTLKGKGYLFLVK